MWNGQSQENVGYTQKVEYMDYYFTVCSITSYYAHTYTYIHVPTYIHTYIHTHINVVFIANIIWSNFNLIGPCKCASLLTYHTGQHGQMSSIHSHFKRSGKVVCT